MKSWLKQRWVVIVSMVILAGCFFAFGGYAVVDPTNNTDSSWAYSLAGLRHDPQQTLGQNVFFTYGPLYERMVTYVHHLDNFSNFLVSNLLFLIILAVILYAYFRLIKLYKLNDSNQGRLLLLLSSLALLISLLAIDTLFYLILLITLLAVRREKSYLVKLVLLSGVYLLSFYKFNLVIPALTLSLIALVEAPTRQKVIRGVSHWLGSLVMFVSFYFILIGAIDLKGFIDYMHLSTANSLAYNEFMSLPYSQYPTLILFYSLVVGAVIMLWLWRCISLARRQRLAESFNFIVGSLIFVTLMFFAFKHGVVRVRLAEFTSFAFPILVFSYLLVRPRDFIEKKAAKHFSIILTGIFIVSIGGFLFYYSQLAPKPYNKAEPAPTIASWYVSRIYFLKSATIHNRLNYGFYKSEVAQAKHDLDARDKYIGPIKSQLDTKYPGRELIFYGNVTIYGDILKQSHPVLLMPGTQNYGANPPQLFDKRYIDFLDQHPNDLVFAEETEPSVDNRIPAHELNEFFQYLIHNYRLVLKDDTNGKRQYVFQRNGGQKESCKPAGDFHIKDDQYMTVPDLPEGATYVKLKVNSMSDSPIAKAATVFVKAPAYNLSLLRVEGVAMTMRTTPTLLEHGVSISPLYLSLGDYFNNTPLPLKAVSINDGFPTGSSYSGQFEACGF